MTTFKGGPAQGTTLNLIRLPFLLRVVRNKAGKIDALNDLHDEPRDDEEIFVYKMEGAPSIMHVCCSDRRKSGWRNSATYRILFPQPDATRLRAREDWSRWCDENAKSLGWVEPEPRIRHI